MVLKTVGEYNLECQQLKHITEPLNTGAQGEMCVKTAPVLEEFSHQSFLRIVVQLLNSLCGLREGTSKSRWTIDKHRSDLGLHRLKSDACVQSEEVVIALLAFSVDDILLLWKDLNILRKMNQKKLMAKSSMACMGAVNQEHHGHISRRLYQLISGGRGHGKLQCCVHTCQGTEFFLHWTSQQGNF